MSEFPVYRSLAELDAEEGGDSLPSFDIDLFDPSDPAEGFRLGNTTHPPQQREGIVERTGAVFIKCKCVDIIHGTLNAATDPSPASLIVFSFRFQPHMPGRRIKHAEIEFRFRSKNAEARRQPEIVKMSLDGYFSLVPTTRSEEHMTGMDGTLGGSVLGLTMSGTLKWERRMTQEATAATHVGGASFTDPEWLSNENCVSWSISENAHRKTGIPAAIRVGVLLKRPNDEEFVCYAKLKTSSDFRTEMGEVFKRHQNVSTLVFDPSLPPTNNLRTYNPKDLGSFTMADVDYVAMTTVLENAVKIMKQTIPDEE